MLKDRLYQEKSTQDKLFTMTTPLYIQYPNGEKRIIQAVFPHPKGLLYFEQFWEKDPQYSVHLIEGEIKGEGPWRVGECSIHVLGCNHTHPQLCEMDAFWHQETMIHAEQFRTEEVTRIALEKGAILPRGYAANASQFISE